MYRLKKYRTRFSTALCGEALFGWKNMSCPFSRRAGEHRAVGGGGLHVRQRVETVERPAYGVERLIAGVVLEPVQYAAVGAFGVVERENRAAERYRNVRGGGDRNAVARQGKRVARRRRPRPLSGDLPPEASVTVIEPYIFFHAVARERGRP